MSLVADILHTCAAAPQPWYPADFVRARPEAVEDVTYCISALCRADILRLVRSPERDVEGFALSPRGAELVRDPAAIDRFVAAEGLDFSTQVNEQARTVRRILMEPARPRVNRLLLLANFLVFGFGLWAAAQKGLFSKFLWPFEFQQGPKLLEPIRVILLDIGALSCQTYLDGDWWRLLSSGFVHISVLHLLMNMYALRVLGTDCEWLWGSGRYACLYLCALVGGSCVGLAQFGQLRPATMILDAPAAGASGAICGLLAAEAVWVILNRRYLPRRLVRRQLRGLFINGLLITAISLVPGVSGAGHFGGAAVGLVAAVLLQLHRFGGLLTKALTLVALVALPVVCIEGLARFTQRQPAWQELRILSADRSLYSLQSQAADLRKETLLPLLRQEPERRPADEVVRAADRLDSLIDRFRALEKRTAHSGPFDEQDREQCRLAIQDFTRLQAAYLERVQTTLKLAKVGESEPHEMAQREAAFRRWIDTRNAMRR